MKVASAADSGSPTQSDVVVEENDSRLLLPDVHDKTLIEEAKELIRHQKDQ